MFKVNNKSTRPTSQEHILHHFLVFVLLTLNKQILAEKTINKGEAAM